MPKRGLIEHRPWLLASIAAAIGFFVLSDEAIGGTWLIVLKGAAVGLLAVYAAMRQNNGEARLLALVMGLSAVGDMAMELDEQAGGLAFFFSHVAAMALYLRHRRANMTPSQKLFAAALLLLTPVISWSLVAGMDGAMQVALYALALGGMAGLAWTSSFPRYRVGVGAVLFVISDLLIFARLGGKLPEEVTSWLIWPIYYLGQFLIATGVIQTLRHELREE